MQTGKVAWPDCFNTFGLLGAASSFSIAHLAVPLPVCVAVQAEGGAPVFMSSKFTVSAAAIPVAMVIADIVTHIFFMASFSFTDFRFLWQRRTDSGQAADEKSAFDGV